MPVTHPDTDPDRIVYRARLGGRIVIGALALFAFALYYAVLNPVAGDLNTAGSGQVTSTAGTTGWEYWFQGWTWLPLIALLIIGIYWVQKGHEEGTVR